MEKPHRNLAHYMFDEPVRRVLLHRRLDLAHFSETWI
jgi:hypothetical protein